MSCRTLDLCSYLGPTLFGPPWSFCDLKGGKPTHKTPVSRYSTYLTFDELEQMIGQHVLFHQHKTGCHFLFQSTWRQRGQMQQWYKVRFPRLMFVISCEIFTSVQTDYRSNNHSCDESNDREVEVRRRVPVTCQQMSGERKKRHLSFHTIMNYKVSDHTIYTPPHLRGTILHLSHGKWIHLCWEISGPVETARNGEVTTLGA